MRHLLSDRERVQDVLQCAGTPMRSQEFCCLGDRSRQFQVVPLLDTVHVLRRREELANTEALTFFAHWIASMPVDLVPPWSRHRPAILVSYLDDGLVLRIARGLDKNALGVDRATTLLNRIYRLFLSRARDSFTAALFNDTCRARIENACTSSMEPMPPRRRKEWKCQRRLLDEFDDRLSFFNRRGDIQKTNSSAPSAS